MTAEIPNPRGLPIVGNALQLPVEGTHQFLADLAARNPGGIFKLNLAGRHVVFVYDPDLVAEVCDESRFVKPIDPPLAHVRDFAGDGLFTARQDEPVWGQAHRILLPAFSQRSMKAYFPQMLEVADKLVAHWSARGAVDVTDDMTRLTLDTITLAGFGQTFDSFDQAELHPFLQAMGRALTEAMNRTRQLPMVTGLKKKADAAYQADIAVMQETVDEVIRTRRTSGVKANDLLGLMLDAADPVTGEKLSDENIRNQVLTFLIAGHETTSGTLSFALHLLLRNPHVLAQAYAEVDRMLPGDTVPTYETIMKLDVIPRILDETLRLLSPIPFIGLASREAGTLGGRYEIPARQKIAVLLRPLHTSSAWDDPEAFDIDRWLPEAKAGHHPHGYKPFGNGERACIGRQFALTEARLALALILQRFAIADPDGHQLHIKQTLTIKPEDFRLRIRPRQEHERIAAAPSAEVDAAPAVADVQAAGVRMRVAYGSNLGTSEDLAQQIADRARRSGFDVTVQTLDELAGDLPTEGLLAVVTSSYNGHAPDNALAFDELSIPAGALDDVRFAVLGNGNTQWSTYQAYPRRVFEKLSGAGARPVVDRGETDASGDFDGMAQAWLDKLWGALGSEFGTAAAIGPRYRVEVLGEDQIRPAVVSGQAHPVTIVAVDELVGDPTGLWDFSREAPRPGVKAITVRLPAGVTYQAGDHLAVYAKNDPELVEWALTTLRVSRDLVIRLGQDGERPTGLPIGVPVTAGLLLTDFVELQDPAGRGQIEVLLQHTRCPWTTRQLTELLAGSGYADEILAKRVSLLSLLERFPAIELPFGVFLELVGTIKPRFYSISSSPRVDESLVTITVGLVDGPSRTGNGRYRGMCSQYLARLQPGDVFYGHVRVPAPPFRPPADPATPMILIGPGTGFAPLRGFLQERALLPGRGPAKLFYGCRHPEHDWLYRAEMQQWAAAGVADLHLAFSAVPDHPHRFVQEALAAEGDAVWELLEQGGHVYLCGDGARMAPAVRGELLTLHRRNTGSTAEQAEAWLRSLEAAGRYQQDVFA
ncbi:bifunctional cytochrome P450/NADPH--P450 reductase [Actinoplanes derwentensis]|uniref:Bifunctional cytochrome P450/NADPH--P450 reductase n=1 Tax=Actinoplanes derwentensis TaxID=113562 RepID=A0A1H2DAE9_9ACTN|nr:cytochrome P450 [Actinoplanes derwentensis]GID81666.1 NADPH--cytochrome P450 reductase [Actinoplanes derwentensis]SDT79557.1 cytochrome P450 / NADPH-cytochrome P450 reductase [Actinoplanes derwentensis]